MNRVQNGKTFFAAAFVLTAILAAPSSSALAADSWLTCKGNMTKLSAKDPTPVTSFSERVLAFNDELKRLYQYSPQRKTLDPMPMDSYSSDKITWAADLIVPSMIKWEGSLDRKSMKVVMSWANLKGDQATWEEHCEPSAPIANEAQVASN